MRDLVGRIDDADLALFNRAMTVSLARAPSPRFDEVKSCPVEFDGAADGAMHQKMISYM